MLAAGATALMKYLEKRMALTTREILYRRFVGKYLSDCILMHHSLFIIPYPYASFLTYHYGLSRTRQVPVR